jgi:4-hydroxybenzoate polyprenyltransferase/phosphoserine phosphatase
VNIQVHCFELISPSRPLCVDLDGTLVRSDLLLESIFALLKRNILAAFLLPFWLFRGKAYFKQQIADRVDLDPEIFPYHDDFLEYLREQHFAGRRLILATASNFKFAETVAVHLGIFDAVLASDREINLGGAKKLERLNGQFGERGYDYAGNSKADLPIFAGSARVILVNPKRGVQTAAARIAEIEKIFDDRRAALQLYLEAMRSHHWIKNLLIFVPLITSHKLGDLSLLIQAGIAFLAFCLCASSVYVLNDLLDLSSDRVHQTKRNRPLASGRISIVGGLLLIPVLLAVAVLLALLIPIKFVAVLAVYYLATVSYSFYLKRAALIDVLVLAGLYTLRVIAGGAAVSVPLSFWLLAFSMFLFLSLALVKRYTELLQLSNVGRKKAAGRGYSAYDLETLAHFGTASGYMATLVLALYINSDNVKILYAHPEVIWLLCPILLYIISRIWLLARRDQLHEDPIVFALRDRRSQLLAAIGGILLLLSAL